MTSPGEQGSGAEIRRREIRELVGLQLGVARVRDDDHLISDLGAESVDLLNLVVAIEDRYGIQVPESRLPELATVADLYELVRGST